MTSVAIPSADASEARSLLDRELADDERLRWVGQPLPGKMARQHAGIFLFALPWSAFVVFHASVVVFIIGHWQLLPFHLPFFAMGAFFLTMPRRAARGARRTLNAITDRRAIVIAPAGNLPFRRELTLRSFTATQTQRREAKDGSGDLVFEETVSRRAKGGTIRIPVGFIAVANVGDVERVLRRELLSSSSPPST